MNASKDKNYSEVSIDNQPIPFREFLKRYNDKLPLFGYVYGDNSIFTKAEFSNGDKLLFLGIQERIEVEPVQEAGEEDYEMPSELRTRRGYLPDNYPGMFQVASPYPDGHRFKTVAELAQDFPEYVLVNEELEVQELGVDITPGDRLKLISRKSNGEQDWMECKHIKTGAVLSLPLDMTLDVTKKADSNKYEPRQLIEKLPLRVRRVSDMGLEIRGIKLTIPGLEAEDIEKELILYRGGIVEAELQDGSQRKIEIPDSLNISVIPSNGKEEEDHQYDEYRSRSPKASASVDLQYGPDKNLHDIAKDALPGKPKFATLIETSGIDLEEYGLKPDEVVVVNSVETKKAVLVKGQKNGFLISTDFRGEFKVRSLAYVL